IPPPQYPAPVRTMRVSQAPFEPLESCLDAVAAAYAACRGEAAAVPGLGTARIGRVIASSARLSSGARASPSWKGDKCRARIAEIDPSADAAVERLVHRSAAVVRERGPVKRMA